MDDCSPGDEFSIDYTTGEIVNETLGKSYQTIAFPEFIQKIMDKGGLISYIDSGRE